MTKDLQGSSHHLKVVGGAYGKRKDFIYEKESWNEAADISYIRELFLRRMI